MEFSTGTQVSSTVCQRNMGGDLRVTRFSRLTSSASSSYRSPSRLTMESRWAMGPLVMTGYPSTTPSGRKAEERLRRGL